MSCQELALRKGLVRTCGDFINNLLRCIFIEVVNHNIGPSRREQQGIAVKVGGVSFSVLISLPKRYIIHTHAFPRPPPAPVTMTVCPLNDSDMMCKTEELWGVKV